MSTAAPEQPPEQPPQPLPPLRQDLRILPGPADASGAKTWLIHDILAHKFHALAARGFTLLSKWEAIPPPDLLAKLNEDTDEPYDEQDIEDMVGFLYAQKLTLVPPAMDTTGLYEQEQAANPAFHKTILHKYLFFRVPLFQPQKFIDAAHPFIAPLYSRAFRWLVILSGLVGGWFALEQWDVFKATFLHFLTFEGLLYYGITLAIIKAIHELGHAFMSRRFGAKVPIIGIAFLVMFPILYTDTTDAWRLTKKRERVLIDAAGMLAELSIACLALLAWSFLPDGPMRSVAFFAATTSWGLSIMVNLNPFMRFDGYYLTCDLFDQRNLQERGFDIGRWHMRETLFGLGRDIPHEVTGKEQFWLTLYAYGTWIYRFFLFIGIAVLVHALFPKALGIFLFVVEILFFIVMPIFRELSNWWSLRMDILKSKKSWLTFSLSSACIVTLLVPWQTSVRAPALLRPSVQTALFPSNAGMVESIFVKDGDHVEQGQLLVKLGSDNLAHERTKSLMRIKLIKAQLSRRAADRQDLNASAVLSQALRKELANLAGYRAEQMALEIRAPHAGIVMEINPELHVGRHIGTVFAVARLVDTGQAEILLFASENHIDRISPHAKVKFIPDGLLEKPVQAQINFIAPTSEEYLTEPIFSSDYRGPIAVKPTQDGGMKPASAIIRLKAKPETAAKHSQAIRGVAHIEASRQSPTKAIYRRIAHVLLRETDF